MVQMTNRMMKRTCGGALASLTCALVAVAFDGVSAQQASGVVSVPVEIAAYPDLVLFNGKIATMDDRSTSATAGTFVKALAVRGREILAVGADDAIVRLAGPKTQRIDLKGRTVIPGIIDPHTHIHNHALSYWLSQNEHVVNEVARYFTVEGKTNAEVRHSLEVLLKERVARLEPGLWAFVSLPSSGSSGTGLGVKFLQDRIVTMAHLDKLTPVTPLLLFSHPSYMINGAAKKALEQTYRTTLTDEVDESGFWNDTAWINRALIVDKYFSDKPDLLAEIVRDGMEKQAAIGITAFSSHVMGTKFIDAIMRLNRAGAMPIRFGYTQYDGFQANPNPAGFYRRMGDLAGLGDDYFWYAAVGLGSVDSGPPRICTTMEAPKAVKDNEYCLNAPGSTTSDAIYTAIMSGQRVALGHSYGDKSVDYFMDDIERAMRDKKDITLEYVRSRRFSSDHCGFYPRADQIPRMAKLGMIISCRANYIDRSYPWLKVYGPQYAARVAPVKSLMAGGVRTVMEAEVRVESGSGPTYFTSYLPYLTRTTRDGHKVSPEEAVDRVQVLKMSTSWASEYLMKEDRLGTLEQGKLADFLVLDKDFFTVPDSDIPSVFPLMTVVGGKIIVLRQEFAKELGRKPVGPQITFNTGGRTGRDDSDGEGEN